MKLLIMLQVGLGVVGARDGLAIITCTCLAQIDLILITNLFFDTLFCESACHELRNPLHAILAMLDLLIDDPAMKSQQLQDILSIQVCAFNMQRLVNDVLDLAKLREGKLALQPVMVSWSDDPRPTNISYLHIALALA